MSTVEAARPAASSLSVRLQALLAVARNAREDAFAMPNADIRLASAGTVAGSVGQAVPAGWVRDAIMGLKLGASLSSQVFAVGGTAIVAIAAELFFPRGTANHDDILAGTRLMTQLAGAYPGALVPERNEQGVVTGLRDRDGAPVMWLDGTRGLRIDEDRFPHLPAIASQPVPPRRLDTVSTNVTANVHGAPWLNQAGEPPYRSQARDVASAHNRTARQNDLLIPVPVLEPGASGAVIGYLRGDAGAITEQVGAMKQSGRMPEDFDLAAMARSVGINWDGAVRQFANQRAFRLAAENPMTLSGRVASVYPDRNEAVTAARAANAHAQPGSPHAMYVPIELDVTSAHFSERGLTHQVYSGSIDKLQDFYETMREQGRLPPGVSFRDLLRESGVPAGESRSVTSLGGQRLDDPQGPSQEERRKLGLDGLPTPDLPVPPLPPESFPRGQQEDPRQGIFENPRDDGLQMPRHTGDDGAAQREAEALLNNRGFLSHDSDRPRPILRPAPQTLPAPLARPAAPPLVRPDTPSITPLTPTEIDQIASHLSRGHAHFKHRREFAEIGINTREEMYEHLVDILTRLPEQKLLANGRAAIYDAASNTFILLDDATRYAITAFRPERGRRYYDNMR
jgi:hypothetical protein